MLTTPRTSPVSRNALIIEAITASFAPVQDRLIFGSLIYPTRRLSHQVNVTRDLHHFVRQIFQKCPGRSWRDPELKRLFVIEENEDAGRHAHFILETPSGMSREELSEICCESWNRIALRERRAAADRKRLNAGIQRHPTEKRRFLIKDHHLVRPSVLVTVRNAKPVTSKRPLAVVKPVYEAAGAVDYCLKWEGRASRFESGELAVEPSSPSVVKGRSLALCLW